MTREEIEIKQGLKEIHEGKVVPLCLIEKRQEIDRVLRLATGKAGEHLEAFKRELAALGVVIKVNRECGIGSIQTGREAYYEPLIEEE